MKPKWINLTNFINVLKCKSTQEELSKKFCQYASKEDGVITNSHEEDAKTFFPSFLCDLRMFDISDSKYWGASFIGVIIFLLIESLIFLSNDFPFVSLLGKLALGLVIVVLLYFAVFFFFLRDAKMKNLFFTLPVMFTSLGLILLNLFLIIFTGWLNSPFLPAFVFINLTIISAPRENSWPIYILTIIAFIILLSPYLLNFNLSNDKNTKNIPDFSEVGKTINMLTLFFTVGIVVVSRSFSSKKIIKK